MITESFDNASPAKINVQKNTAAPSVDCVIYTFSHVIEKYVVETFGCEKVGELLMASGNTSVYTFTHHGRKFGFFKTWVGAPACVGTVEELQTVLDCSKFVHFGGAGCLNKEIARGKVMIPTEAYRDEGTSYHYAPASDYIRIKNWKMVRDFMEEKKIPYVDPDGTAHSPETPNGYKFETLILDMVHMMDDCLGYEVDRNREFAPVKNKTGVDSVESARALLKLNGVEL